MEGLESGSSELLQFRFLLVSAEDYSVYKETHELVGKAESFSRLSLNSKEFPPVKIVLEDRVLVLMKRRTGCNKVEDGS